MNEGVAPARLDESGIGFLNKEGAWAIMPDFDGVTAVSYTHLDVYKRQDMFINSYYGGLLDSHPGIKGYNLIFLSMIALCVIGLICGIVLYKLVYSKKKESVGEKELEVAKLNS